MKRDYIITHSGRMVSATQESVPSESDIALSLSRQPRFAGMTRVWWSVLDHSLYVAQLAMLDGEAPRTVVAALLHDAHEFTGDIPTPFKTPEQREVQVRLDQQIFRAYLPDAGNEMPYQIKELDHRALLAEAFIVGPPSLDSLDAVRQHFGEEPHTRDLMLLGEGLRSGALGVHPSELARGEKATNVEKFLWMLDQYRNLASGNELYIYGDIT